MRNKFTGSGEPGFHPIRKIRTALSGLRYAVVYDFSVAYKLIFSIAILILTMLFQDWIDAVIIIVVTSVVLIAEIINSAVEALCDFIEPAYSEKIKIIKDMAAAAVGVSIAAWLIVIFFELHKILSG